MRDMSLSQSSMATGEVKVATSVIPLQFHAADVSGELVSDSVLLGFRRDRKGALGRLDYVHTMCLQRYGDALETGMTRIMECTQEDPVFIGILLGQAEGLDVMGLPRPDSTGHQKRHAVSLSHAGKAYVLPYWQGVDLRVGDRVGIAIFRTKNIATGKWDVDCKVCRA